jgi:serine phosphatase RsbU (regulator of sigma subunit)
MIEKNAQKPAAFIQDAILNSITEFRSDYSLCDDLTITVLKAV